MLLKSIKLNNIRSYLNQEVKFPEGSTLLAGDVGSGKSSILLAVEFALFGARRKHLPAEALLRNGKNKGFIELELVLDGKEIVIRRSLKRTKSEVKQEKGSIIIDGVKKEVMPVELKALILDLLGYPKELLTKSKSLIFRYTVYTPQELMKQILTDDKDYRIDSLRKVFGIDKYKRIKENCQLFVRSLKEKKEILKIQSEGLDEKKKEKDVLENSIKKFEKEKFVLMPKLGDVRSKLSLGKDNLKEFEEKIKQLNELKRKLSVCDTQLNEKVEQRQKNKEEIEVLAEQISELREKIDSIKIKKPSEKNVEEIESLVAKREKNILEVSNKRDTFKQKTDFFNEKIEELNKEIAGQRVSEELASKEFDLESLKEGISKKKEVEDKIKETEKIIKELHLHIKEIEVHKNNSEELKEVISKLDNCPTCLQSVSDEHKNKITSKENQKIDLHVKKLDELKENEKVNLVLLEGLKKEFEEIIHNEKQLEALKVVVSNLKEKTESLKEKQNILTKIISEKDAVEKEYILVKNLDLGALKKQVEENKKLLKGLVEYEKKSREKRHLAELLNEKNNNLMDLKESQEQIKRDVGDVNLKKISLNKETKALSDSEKEYEKIKNKIEELLKKEKNLELEKFSIEKEIENTTKTNSILNKEIEEKIKIKDKLNYMAQLHNWLENYFIELMGVMEKQVMARIYLEFNDVFKEWFDILIDDELINIRLDDEFTPVIEQNGYDISLENLSGGERTSVALAYRLALNKVVNDVITTVKTKDLIILDEPTDGFSSEQLDRIRTVIDKMNTKQVIIVSHESKIESFVDNVIKIRKNEHVSEVEG